MRLALLILATIGGIVSYRWPQAFYWGSDTFHLASQPDQDRNLAVSSEGKLVEDRKGSNYSW